MLLRYQNGLSQMPDSFTQVQLTCRPLNAIPLLEAYHKRQWQTLNISCGANICAYYVKQFIIFLNNLDGWKMICIQFAYWKFIEFVWKLI